MNQGILTSLQLTHTTLTSRRNLEDALVSTDLYGAKGLQQVNVSLDNNETFTLNNIESFIYVITTYAVNARITASADVITLPINKMLLLTTSIEEILFTNTSGKTSVLKIIHS